VTDPVTSAAALLEQRRQVSEWLQSQSIKTAVSREIVEGEGHGGDRPALAEAIAWCKLQGIPLVVPRTEPIGIGDAFYPRIISIPLIVLPQLKRPTPPVIAVPERAPEQIALYVSRHIDDGVMPIYLTNLSERPLTDVIINGDSLYLDIGATIPTNSTQRRIARIAPGTAQLIEEYDVRSAGEFIDLLHVTFADGIALRYGVAILGLRVQEDQFIRLKLQA
jgi:hypothetical protein